MYGERQEDTFHFQNDYPESIRSNAYVDFVLLRLIIGLFYWPSMTKEGVKKGRPVSLFIQPSFPHVTLNTVNPC